MLQISAAWRSADGQHARRRQLMGTSESRPFRTPVCPEFPDRLTYEFLHDIALVMRRVKGRTRASGSSYGRGASLRRSHAACASPHRRWFVWLRHGRKMLKAILRTVASCIERQDLDTLEELRAHRARVISALSCLRDFDVRIPLRKNQDDLAIIDDGIARLRASRPEA